MNLSLSVLAIGLSAVGGLYAQSAYEPFNYPPDTELAGQGGWVLTMGTSGMVEAGNLDVSGLAPSFGNRFAWSNELMTVRLPITPVASGSIYFSFALRIDDLGSFPGGEAIAGLSSGTTNSFMAKIHVVFNSPGLFQLGIYKGNGNITTFGALAPQGFPEGATIFIVARHTFNPGSGTDDLCDLWLNPPPSSFGGATPPAPTIAGIGAGGGDLAQLDRFVWRASSVGGPTYKIVDELRIGSSWAAVTPTGTATNLLPASGPIVPELAPLEQAMTNFMLTHGFHAGTIGLMKDSKLVLREGYGWRDTNLTVIIHPDNLFRLASVSKPITASATRKLLNAGAISASTRVYAYLGIVPWGGLLGDNRITNITVQHLLDHAGGWNRDTSPIGDPVFSTIQISSDLGLSYPAAPTNVISWVLSKPLDFTPGTTNVYSNFGYDLLGRVIEKATGKSYVSYVQQDLLGPFGVTNFIQARSRPRDLDPWEVRYADPTPFVRSAVDYPTNIFIHQADGGLYYESFDAFGGLVAPALGLCRYMLNYWVDGDRRVPGSLYNWTYIFYGSLPGTTSVIHQDINQNSSSTNGLEFAALFNARTGATPGIDNDQAHTAIVNATTNVSSWPANGGGAIEWLIAQANADKRAGSVTVPLIRSGSSTLPVKASYTTYRKTAGTNTYVSQAGIVSFAPGETSKPVTISIIDDGQVGPSGQFLLELISASGGAWLGPRVTCEVSILDNSFLQGPDLSTNGLDVRATTTTMLADDFRANATGPITQIRIWGAWRNDITPSSNCFCLGIWSDLPGSGTNYSRPGQQLCNYCFGPGQFTNFLYNSGIFERFYDPNLPGTNGLIGTDMLLREYIFDLPTNQPCWQTNGNTYWLSVAAGCLDTNQFLFGWKTYFGNFNDHAVFGHLTGTNNPLGDWQELRRPSTTNPLDLAFQVIGVQTNPCPPATLTCPADKSVACSSAWTVDAPSVVDGCCGTNYTLTRRAVTNGFCPQRITFTWTATNCLGAIASCSSVVTVIDTTPPVLTCAPNKTVVCGTAWTFDAPTATDACCTNISINIVSTTTNGAGCPQYVSRVWQAVDCCSNSSATCTQVVTLVQGTDKWVQIPDTTTNGLDVRATEPLILADDFRCNATGPITQVRLWTSWRSDSVAPTPCFCLSLWADVPRQGTNFSRPGQLLCNYCFVPGQYTNFAYTNGVSERFYDPDRPGTNGLIGADTVIREYDFNLPTNAPCYQTNGHIYWLSVTTDCLDTNQFLLGWKTCPTNFNGDAVFGHLSAFNNPLGDWQELRRPGATNSLDLAFEIVTPINPCPPIALACAPDKTVQCGGTWTLDVPAVFESCCGTNYALSYTAVTNGACPQVITFIWSVTNCSGSSATCNQAVTIVDTNPPVLTCAPNKTVVCGTVWDFDPPTASDACCAGVTINLLSSTTNGSGCTQIVARAWQAVDCCSNASAVCTQIVTVSLTADKWLQIPDTTTNGLNVAATGPVNPLVLADDFQCHATGPISEVRLWGSWGNDSVPSNPCFCLSLWSDVPAQGTNYSRPGELLCNYCFSVGTNQGLYTNFVYTNVVSDRIYDPTISNNGGFIGSSTVIWEYVFDLRHSTCFQTNGNIYWLSVAVGCLPGQYLFGWKTCPTNFNDDAVYGFANGFNNLQVDWHDLRRPGNTNQSLDLAFQVVTGTNTCPPPQLFCPPDRTVVCGSAWTNDLPFISVGSSNCCGSNYTLTVTASTNGICPQIITYNWQVTDCIGKTAACFQRFTLISMGAGMLSCAPNKVVQCGTAWTFDEPRLATCCPTNVTINIVSTITNGSGCTYSVSRSWQAVDCCSNLSSTCTQVVTVADNTPPVVSCPPDIVVLTCSNSVQVTWIASANDACSGSTPVFCNPPSGSSFARDTTNTVSCFSFDSCGNSTNCTFRVIVRRPSLSVTQTGPGTVTVTWADGGVLQRAPSVAGPWSDVPFASSPYTTTSPGFYRLRCP